MPMPKVLYTNPAKVALPTPATLEDRRKKIEAKKEQLNYDYVTIPKLALAKGLPQFVELSDEYTLTRMKNSTPMVLNGQMAKVRRVFDLVNRIEDYDDYFINEGVTAPTLVDKWNEDLFFAEQRLSGANPLAIKLLEADDPRVEVLYDVDFNFDVNNQVAKGNIYICDYSGTDPAYRGPLMVAGGISKAGKQKYLPKPMAWFRWVDDKSNEQGGYMEPLAIQLDCSTDAVTYERKYARIYTPNEKHPLDWTMAKICVQAADAMHHEMSSHLARCHFTIEPIAVAVHRTIADEHPIALLLNTHTRFHIANDSVAAYTLIAPKEKGGTVDDIMPGTLKEAMALLTESYDKWDLLGTNFNNDLSARNMANTDRLPHYPYRDDGRLLWDAIEEWVGIYINAFYSSDAEVADDTEIQDWCKECIDQTSGGRVKGMPYSIRSRDLLREVLCSIIFVCGPGHSAINFGQYEYMAFIPNMPLSVYQDVQLLSEQTTPVTEEQLMKILPDSEHAELQLEIVFNLTAYKYDQLGNYDKTFNDWFGHGFEEHMSEHHDVKKGYQNFQKTLEKVEKEMEKRNEKRSNPFTVMLPSKVLNSVSI